jgi:hypothetical protein
MAAGLKIKTQHHGVESKLKAEDLPPYPPAIVTPDGKPEITARRPSNVRVVGNPSVTRPNGQRRVRCGLPVIRNPEDRGFSDTPQTAC